MNRAEFTIFVKKIATWILKALLILLLPITLYFRRDFDHFGLVLLAPSGISAFYSFVLSLGAFKTFKSTDGRETVWVIVAILTLTTCILFGNKISLLHEIMTFRLHQDNFSKLVELAQNTPPEREIQDTLVKLPEEHKEWTNQPYLVVFKGSENSLRLIALRSRPNTYYVYLPDYENLPGKLLHVQYNHNVDCFYKLTQHWFVCDFFR